MQWPDDVDAVIGGDQAIMLAYVTPAKGVVLMPVTNFAVRDRAAGTLTAVNSSVGVSKKLERIRADAHVSLAYHTRDHGWTDRPEYVLVQGLATLTGPHPRYMDTIRESFEFYVGGHPRGGRFWDWWLAAWHLRMGVELAVERIVVWPDLACGGPPTVHGTPLPDSPPPPQRPPRNGTGPRLDAERAGKRAAAIDHTLLGWVGSDGFPVVLPVDVAGADERGITLHAPPGAVPGGGRRAGLTAHSFGRYVLRQHQRIHTGWLDADGESIVYAPHTKAGYRMPQSKLLYRVVSGAATRWGMRQARERGFVPAEPT